MPLNYFRNNIPQSCVKCKHKERKSHIRNNSLREKYGEEFFKLVCSLHHNAQNRAKVRGRNFYAPWLDLELFAEYIYELWKPLDKTIRYEFDDIDGKSGYIPGNVRFTTASINNYNQSDRPKIVYKGIKTALNLFCKEVLLTRDSNNKFRHGGTNVQTYVRQMAEKGYSGEEVLESLRHSELWTTQKIYGTNEEWDPPYCT